MQPAIPYQPARQTDTDTSQPLTKQRIMRSLPDTSISNALYNDDDGDGDIGIDLSNGSNNMNIAV